MIGAGCCEYFSGGLGAELKNQRDCDIGTGALHVEMVDFCSGDAVGRRYLVPSKTQRCKGPYPVSPVRVKGYTVYISNPVVLAVSARALGS